MPMLFLAATILVLAAALLRVRSAGNLQRRVQESAEDSPAPIRQRPEDSAALELLAEAVEALLAVMEHPDLGGPGFLSIQFPPGSLPAAAAQFPNISEALYRRVIRQELNPAELAAAGVPAALLRRSPTFSAESGGMIQISVEIRGVEPELLQRMTSRRDRAEILPALAAALGRRFPKLSVRCLGADLLLTPLRTEAEERDAASSL